MVKIPYNKTDISLSDKDMSKLQTIIKSGNVVRGTYVKRLAKHFKDRYDVHYAIPCANATSGLVISLQSIMEKGFAVELPAFTWYSTLYAVECAGAIPVFLDINNGSWLIEDKAFFAHIVIPVDIFGNKIHLKNIKGYAIYDAAHGYGLSNLGHRGIAEVVSLSFTKVVQGMQGGVILTNDRYLADQIQWHVDTYSKMTEVNAFVALKSIEDYAKNYDARLKIVDRYRKHLKVHYTEQSIPESTNYSVYALLFDSMKIRNTIERTLRDNGVETKVYYVPLVHGLVNTDDVYSRILSLPIYPGMESKVQKICSIINEADI